MYKETKNQDGYNDRVQFEHEVLEEHYRENLPMNRDLSHKKLKFSPTYENEYAGKYEKTTGDFLSGYDSTDYEVTMAYMEYLHTNPYVFRKIRFLQRENKMMSVDNLPELDRLRQIKTNIVTFAS